MPKPDNHLTPREDLSKFDPKQKQYPVYATQGGGLVRPVDDTFVFITSSNVPGLEVGDIMPTEWGIIPANKWAMEEINEQSF